MATSLPPSGRKRGPSPSPYGKPRRRPTDGSRPPARRVGRSPSTLPSGLIALAQQGVVQPSRFRLVLVWLVLILASVGLAGKLFYLQVIESTTLKQRAADQQLVQVQRFVPRRSITDRSGNVLAIDHPSYILYAHPKLFKQSKVEVATALAPVLGQDVFKVAQQFDQGESGLEMAYDLSESIANQVKQLAIDGLELVQHPQRMYPQADLFASVIGFVDIDRKGQAGIESTYEGQLRHDVREVMLSMSGDGSILPDRVPADFLKNNNNDAHLQLSLDSRLQRTARAKLKQQIAKYQAKRGAVLVMDVRDGSMPVVVTEPSYDPNRYSEAKVELFRNWAIADLYEPGSTFKPINVAIALEQGVISPDDSFYDEGYIEVGGWPIQNYDYKERGGRGDQTVTQILAQSSNVGMVHIMKQLDPTVYYSWLERLQIEKPSGVDLPFEASGQLKDVEQFTSAPIESATTAFGQGFSLTPLKLLQLHGALANGGKMLTPHVVRGVFNSAGQTLWQPALPPATPLFSPSSASTVLGMMESVVDGGTGKVAYIPGYRIAGKTGTAQKADPNGGYMPSARITSFVSTFPLNAPQYVVLVVIDEPQGEDAYGSTVAAPIARSMMEALISVEGLQPTEPIDDSHKVSEDPVALDADADSAADDAATAEEGYSEDYSDGYSDGYSEDYGDGYSDGYSDDSTYEDPTYSDGATSEGDATVQ